MSMFRSLSIAAAVITLSVPAFAAQATSPKPAPKPATQAVAAKPAKAEKVTMITATGTVSKFDAATNTLTVTTAKGDQAFMLDSAAKVTANGKKVMASDLPNHVGHKVTVSYTDANGHKMAQSVRVTMAASKTASMKKTASTPSTPSTTKKY